MSAYPLIFTIRELIPGNGFLAGVVSTGRCLMVDEGEEGWWLYGVEPGGIAADGQTPQEAHLKFILAVRHLLADLSAQSATFDDFVASAKAFFCAVDREDLKRWTAAVAEVRSGAPVEMPMSFLPRQRAETPCAIDILELGQAVKMTPQWNSSESFAIPETETAAA